LGKEFRSSGVQELQEFRRMRDWRTGVLEPEPLSANQTARLSNSVLFVLAVITGNVSSVI